MKLLEDLIHKYGMILLVIFYLVINLVYKNLINLVLFMSILVFSYPMFKNKTNCILFTLVASLIVGIYRNFHLLENFETEKKIIILSKKLLKHLPPNKIKKRKLKLKEMKRVLPRISKAEVDSLKDELDTGYSNVSEYPLFVSSDNFIIQGHSLHYLLTIYPELGPGLGPEQGLDVYQIKLSLDDIVRRIPMIRLMMSGVSNKDYNLLDISKIVKLESSNRLTVNENMKVEL